VAYVCGIDIGGTFTDCAIVDGEGRLFPGKAPTTPEDRSQGFFDSLSSAADQAGVELVDLLKGTERLLHGTTVATNAVVERKGAKVGLITTRGHRDVILMMRGTGRTVGLPVEAMLNLVESDKPVPLVPRSLIREVDERVDYAGEVIVALDQNQARAAVHSLIEQGVEAICVSFLWSFENPRHEDAVVEIIREIAPDLFVTAAHSLIPKWGEYERTVGAVINSFIGPVTKRYLQATSDRLRAHGYERPFLIMQSTGGLAPVRECEHQPLLTVGSGPVGGLEGARFLAGELGIPNVIAADMGGTTFDVGLIVDGHPTKSTTTAIGQYQYSLPVVDLQSIGSGGGSIAWFDEMSGALRVGPESAGANPGPACYGRGGTQATITDANVVLGFLNPSHFLGGNLTLDRDAAIRAVSGVASRLEMSTEQAAAGIVTIAEFHMADLIRRMTVQRGVDPRDFVLLAYGGAGPVHAAIIARELGVKKVIVPLGDVAGAWSALGVATANVLRVFGRTQVTYEPFDPQALNEGFGLLEEQARADLAAQGFSGSDIELRRFAAMQYGWQVHQVEVPVPGKKLSEPDMPRLIEDFEALYARLYGEGAGFRQAGVQIIDLRLEAVGLTPKPVLSSRSNGHASESGRHEVRDVFWPDSRKSAPTGIFLGKDLTSGQQIEGPAIVEQEFTTVVIHPGQSATVDDYGNIIIEIEQARVAADASN
jgi:N-methylhydantoinase A